MKRILLPILLILSSCAHTVDTPVDLKYSELKNPAYPSFTYFCQLSVSDCRVAEAAIAEINHTVGYPLLVKKGRHPNIMIESFREFDVGSSPIFDSDYCIIRIRSKTFHDEQLQAFFLHYLVISLGMRKTQTIDSVTNEDFIYYKIYHLTAYDIHMLRAKFMPI